MPKLLLKLTALAVVVFCITLATLGTFWREIDRVEKLTTIARQQAEEQELKNRLRQVLDPIAIEGRAVAVYDIYGQKLLYGRNENVVMPIASLTKLMTAWTANNSVATDTIITITNKAIAEEGDSGLRIDEKWHLRDLSDLMLVSSSNDAARAIADSVETATNQPFILTMNQEANNMGLRSTDFQNPTGLDILNNSGSRSTAQEIGMLLSHIHRQRPEILGATTQSAITRTAIGGINHTVLNTNQRLAEFYALRASKTGFTDLTRGALAVIVEPHPGQPITIVILGSSQDGRFTDIIKLENALIPVFTSL